MRNTVTNVIELLIGAILLSLGLLYITSQYRALSYLTDITTREIIEDSNVLQQNNDYNSEQISDEEVCATIMGYREYPIMVDEHLIPNNGQDYEQYLTYVKSGNYRKDYRYSIDRRIIMIVYSFLYT